MLKSLSCRILQCAPSEVSKNEGFNEGYSRWKEDEASSKMVAKPRLMSGGEHLAMFCGSSACTLSHKGPHFHRPEKSVLNTQYCTLENA